MSSATPNNYSDPSQLSSVTKESKADRITIKVRGGKALIAMGDEVTFEMEKPTSVEVYHYATPKSTKSKSARRVSGKRIFTSPRKKVLKSKASGAKNETDINTKKVQPTLIMCGQKALACGGAFALSSNASFKSTRVILDGYAKHPIDMKEYEQKLIAGKARKELARFSTAGCKLLTELLEVFEEEKAKPGFDCSNVTFDLKAVLEKVGKFDRCEEEDC